MEFVIDKLPYVLIPAVEFAPTAWKILSTKLNWSTSKNPSLYPILVLKMVEELGIWAWALILPFS